MKPFRVPGSRLYVHPLFPVALALYALCGRLSRVPAVLLALLAHEGGHVLAARLLRVKLERVEITPFGGIISAPDIGALSSARAVCFALAGPAVSLCMAAMATLLALRGVFAPGVMLRHFQMNAVLLLCNLLPVWPLDGGRALHAALSSRLDPVAARRAMECAGVTVGALASVCALWLSFRGVLAPSLAFFGCYLMYAARTERRAGAMAFATGLIARRARMARGDVLPMETLAASGTMRVCTLLSRLTPGAAHRVYVMDAHGECALYVADDKFLLAAALDSPGETLLSLTPRKNAFHKNEK